MRAIISNNCWGAEPYKEAAMQFNTPFIGLFLYSDDFIDLISNFRANIESKIKFVTSSKKGNEPAWPVGVLGDDIEIHFMHYKSAEEAYKKWNYRTLRLPKNDDDLLFKMCDRDGFTLEYAKKFDELRFANKIFFYNNKKFDLPSRNIFYPIDAPGEECPDGVALWKISREKHDLSIAQWLKGDVDYIGDRYKNG